MQIYLWVCQLRAHEDTLRGLVAGDTIENGVKPVQHVNPVVQLTLTRV